ncbi:MAG TPA: DUF899 domain-containing protein [Ilumatobacteraceae bacterium]|nr:DUF899 domain-containing protein [Ilumatobacteraceae bacterium]
MNLPAVVSRDEWLAARKELLAAEKESTRARDELNTRRRNLPMVRVDTTYKFEGPDGEIDLLGLFGDRRQLIVQHFMFDPEWTDGCPSCTASLEEISDATFAHLEARDTVYVAIARAPFAKLEAYRTKRNWPWPIYSSYGSDFNYDFGVTIDASKAPVMFNFRGPEELKATGFDWILDTDSQPMEQPGVSCFLRDGDDVFHTYSTFARGTELAVGAYPLLDLTALGRQEDWEEPKGRVANSKPPNPDFA